MLTEVFFFERTSRKFRNYNRLHTEHGNSRTLVIIYLILILMLFTSNSCTSLRGTRTQGQGLSARGEQKLEVWGRAGALERTRD